MEDLTLRIPGPPGDYIRLGTCSWKYDSWSGLLYPADRLLHADDYLEYYARQLQTVEVDQWFWSLFPSGIKLPDRGTVECYAGQVPNDFEFTVKAPNALTLTHFYSRQSPRYKEFAGRENEHFLSVDLLNRFLDSLAPLGTKIGPIMFQFEYLNKKKMPSKKAFLDRLHEFFAAAPSEFRYAVECRNPNYLAPDFYDVLRTHGVGNVIIDGYYMPPLADIVSNHDAVTADFSIIRLLGPDRQKIEDETGSTWNRIIDPHDKGLEAAVEIIRTNVKRKIRTYVNVNNHYEGSALHTIDRLTKLFITSSSPSS